MAIKENKFLTIDGDIVRVEKRVIERTVRTSDFLAELARQQPVDSGVLPSNCRMMSRVFDKQNRTRTICVIEVAPGMKTIQFSPERQSPNVRELKLSWPRTLWFARCIFTPGQFGAIVEDIWPASIAQPLEAYALETPLFQLLMPNIYDTGNGAVCLGNLAVADTQPLSLRIDTILAEIFNSLWNTDLMPSFQNTGIENLDDWAKQSLTNPEFHTQIKFPRHAFGTLNEMLRRLAEVNT
jgi:hypothetical protein